MLNLGKVHTCFILPLVLDKVQTVQVSFPKLFREQWTNINCMRSCESKQGFGMGRCAQVFSLTLAYLGMVTHLVLQFCVVMAFSSSSSWPVFFSFFTRLLTAFSHHFSSWPFCSPPPAPPEPLADFFQPSRRFTTGGVNGKMDDILRGVLV